MMTVEPIAAGELTSRTGRAGVRYQDSATGRSYDWDPVNAKFRSVDGRVVYKTGADVAGTATVTAAQLATGHLIFSGGAGTQTLPTCALLAAELRAGAGTTFDFSVDNTAGSGTCTIAASSGIVAGPAVITGGATLTVADSATQGIGLFRIVFSSATVAVLFRIG